MIRATADGESRPTPARKSAGARVLAAFLTAALLLAACGNTVAPTGGPSAGADGASVVPPSNADASQGAPATPTVAPTASPIAVAIPASASVVKTRRWGSVPVNQLIVVLNEGRTAADAEAVASAVGGKVVGALPKVRLYQLEVTATSEAELLAARRLVRAEAAVAIVTVNQGLVPDAEGEIWGVRTSALTDPAYDGENGDGYGLIGVQTAWDYIRGSGMGLKDTKVGVVDSGLYSGTGEFDKGAKISYTDPAGQLADPEPITYSDGTTGADPSYGHGTGVTSIIGADASNGGVVGVASVLGDKLEISNTNLWGAPYGQQPTAAAPDPANPAIQQYGQSGTFAFGDLAAIMAQVNAGSTVINLSWGAGDYKTTDPELVKVYQSFFAQMAKEHPEVIFVAAAGNDGQSMNGSQYYPAGLSLPNMITVGNVNNDGKVNTTSNTAGQDFEVSIFAPGNQAVRAVNKDSGEVAHDNGGTSMATPQVAATAALLHSLNADLTAAQIKKIITTSARKTEAGTTVLAVDAAVKMVIDLNCDLAGIPRMDEETLRGRGVIDAVAVPIKDAEGEYFVRAIVTSTGVKGAPISIDVKGGAVTNGETPRTITGEGELGWTVKLDAADKGSIFVRRADSRAGSRITIETIDINGSWAGTFTLTSLTVDEATKEKLKDQGCEAAILQALVGKALPMTLDLKVKPNSSGTGVLFIDVSSLKGSDGKPMQSEPQDIKVRYSGNQLTVNFGASASGTTMSGTVSKSGDLVVIKGTVKITGSGYAAKGTWTVKPSGG